MNVTELILVLSLLLNMGLIFYVIPWALSHKSRADNAFDTIEYYQSKVKKVDKEKRELSRLRRLEQRLKMLCRSKKFRNNQSVR